MKGPWCSFSRKRAIPSCFLARNLPVSCRADSRGGRRLDHRVGAVDRLHRQDRRGAALQQLEAGQTCGRPQRGRRVRRLHRPDPRPEPFHQTQIVGVSAEERLAEMNVSLDESGKKVMARGVEDDAPLSRTKNPTAGQRVAGLFAHGTVVKSL